MFRRDDPRKTLPDKLLADRALDQRGIEGSWRVMQLVILIPFCRSI